MPTHKRKYSKINGKYSEKLNITNKQNNKYINGTDLAKKSNDKTEFDYYLNVPYLGLLTRDED